MLLPALIRRPTAFESLVTDPIRRETMIAACHAGCIACRSRETGGLGLRFAPGPDGSVEAVFTCDAHYQGYPDRLHGGVIAMLLDAAMTHWLFMHGVRGVTAKLNVRYHQPVRIETPAWVRARLVGERPPLHILQAEIVQADDVRASAEGTFSSDAGACTV